MQYTIRGIPPAVDAALRERARAAGTSLNEAAVDALAEGSGLAGTRRQRRDLSDIAKTWNAEKAVEAALADQDRGEAVPLDRFTRARSIWVRSRVPP